MREKKAITVFSLAACAMLFAIPALAADKPTTTKKATTTEAKAVRTAWPPEMLSGQILSVDAADHTVIVKDASGVPFDILVTPKTKIESASDQKLKLSDLSSDTKRQVSIHYTPERKGDVARSIDLTSQG